jgi:Na+/H+-dicarboxylate symporter
VSRAVQAVSLDRFAGDLAIILALDWLLDRCRTVINLLGDSFGVMLIHHLTGQDDAPSGGSSQPYASLEMT